MRPPAAAHEEEVLLADSRAINANELISCFRVVHGSCAIPLTKVEEEIATAQLLYVCSAIESMLATWNDDDGCERAAAKLVDPYKGLVELLGPRLSETQLRNLSIPIAIELREFSSAACGRDFGDRGGLKRQWESIALAITPPLS